MVGYDLGNRTQRVTGEEGRRRVRSGDCQAEGERGEVEG
jgi:hypothetical protein